MRHLLCALLLVSACQCSDETKTPDAGPDAATIPELSQRSMPLTTQVDGLKLTPDESLIVFCSTWQEIGFVDAKTLTVLKQIDLQPLYPGIDKTGNCRLTIIGDAAYAYYGEGTDTAAVVKMSWQRHEVTNVWFVPKQYLIGVWDFLRHDGLVAAREPGMGFLTLHRLDRNQDGIELVYVDLETGEFSERQLADVGLVDYSSVWGVVDGDKVFGYYGLQGEGMGGRGLGGFDYLANLADGSFVWKGDAYENDAIDFEANPETWQLAVTYVPSRGWDIVSLEDGSLIRHLSYVNPAFNIIPKWLDQKRVALVESGSRECWVDIIDSMDGRLLGEAVLNAGAASDAVLSKDRSKLFVGGTKAIFEITIPK